MKPNVHPNYNQVLAKCVCGHEFYFYSTLDSKYINVEVCNECHPFYTGTQKTAAVTGRVDSFNRKFQNRQKAQPEISSTTKKPIKSTKKEPSKKEHTKKESDSSE